MAKDQDLITAQVLADALNLSVDTIWKYTREKKIPFIELGSKQYRYVLSDVIKALASPAVQEKAGEYKTEPDRGKFTYKEYLEMPNEPGYRIEILEGMMIKEPAPNVMHQRVSRRLQRILEDFFWEADPEGEIFNAPLDVTYGDTTVVQPDLLYISRDQKQIVQETRVDGPPALIVEVLSPSTSRKDRLQKMQIYQKAQVKHYWLVDPLQKTLECFSLRDGLYALVASGMEDDIVDHPDFKGLSISLEILWKGNKHG